VCGLAVTKGNATGETLITSDARDIGRRALAVLIDETADIRSGSQYFGMG
jgi:hypothetical protein